MQKLVLGTANFGNRYGIANKTDLSQDEIDKILSWSSGKLEELDTSEDYGESHTAISNHANNFKVTTKINLNEITSTQEIPSRISSLKMDLRCNSVHRILFRPCENNSAFTLRAVRELQTLQEKCNVEEIGLTIYETKELEFFANELEGPLTFQIPLNILNRSFEYFVTSSTEIREDISFYARSIFLQGLLFMDTREVPARLREINPTLLALNENLDRIGLSILEATFSYIKSQKWLKGVVIGVSSLVELQNNLGVFENINLGNLDFLEGIHAPSAIIVDPRRW